MSYYKVFLPICAHLIVVRFLWKHSSLISQIPGEEEWIHGFFSHKYEHGLMAGRSAGWNSIRVPRPWNSQETVVKM